jgi:SpoVK/Ycf46/Vps4 family AAA+-type ATPase
MRKSKPPLLGTLLFPFVLATALFTIVEIASAMSALEFLRVETDNKEAPMMKEIVIKLASKGYKNVPDWAKLSSITRQRILEKGYTTEDIEAIAEEAALTAGMTRR